MSEIITQYGKIIVDERDQTERTDFYWACTNEAGTFVSGLFGVMRIEGCDIGHWEKNTKKLASQGDWKEYGHDGTDMCPLKSKAIMTDAQPGDVIVGPCNKSITLHVSRNKK